MDAGTTRHVGPCASDAALLVDAAAAAAGVVALVLESKMAHRPGALDCSQGCPRPADSPPRKVVQWPLANGGGAL
jgi:hypothetical protein